MSTLIKAWKYRPYACCRQWQTEAVTFLAKALSSWQRNHQGQTTSSVAAAIEHQATHQFFVQKQALINFN